MTLTVTNSAGTLDYTITHEYKNGMYVFVLRKSGRQYIMARATVSLVLQVITRWGWSFYFKGV